MLSPPPPLPTSPLPTPSLLLPSHHLSSPPPHLSSPSPSPLLPLPPAHLSSLPPSPLLPLPFTSLPSPHHLSSPSSAHFSCPSLLTSPPPPPSPLLPPLPRCQPLLCSRHGPPRGWDHSCLHGSHGPTVLLTLQQQEGAVPAAGWPRGQGRGEAAGPGGCWEGLGWFRP